MKKNDTFDLTQSEVSFNLSLDNESFQNYPTIKKKYVKKHLKCLNCKNEMCFTTDLNTKLKLFECKTCGKIQSSELKGLLICNDCKFTLCSKCRLCPNGHFLHKVYNIAIENQPKNFVSHNNYMVPCDLCDEIIKYQKSKEAYICWRCGYLVCSNCILFSKGKLPK